jgi:hypothetical protein
MDIYDNDLMKINDVQLMIDYMNYIHHMKQMLEEELNLILLNNLVENNLIMMHLMMIYLYEYMMLNMNDKVYDNLFKRLYR